jgi:predicted AlkP superfamily pyrophosphatase or phosphodiesterase
MLQRLLVLTIAFINTCALAQTNKNVAAPNVIERPKLVVGIVVDQMRWDFLYRYYNRYTTNGGFKRMINQGFSCENTFIPYTPTVTACGHTCIYTGSVPNIHGITGNTWWDKLKGRSIYCAEDKTVQTVGSASMAGQMSPVNMLTTSICDELRLSNNFESKVIGVAVKDRGSILPAGHSANAAYWYDGSNGNWITSTYYMNELPAWVNNFNAKKLPDAYLQKGWQTLYPLNTYTLSTKDENAYEVKSFGANATKFPYDLSGFAGKSYGTISATPFGNSLTLEMAKAALDAEKLGLGKVTDFLAVSLSSTDYVGHAYGPNSVETEDTYLRLDKDLGEFLNYLDTKVGRGQYLVFLSADHGVAHVPGFLKENKLPGGTADENVWANQLSLIFKQKFGVQNLIVSTYNYQIHLNHTVIDSLKLDETAITKEVISYLSKQEAVSEVFELNKLMQVPMQEKKRSMLANGYYPARSGDIQIILKPGYIDGGATGTTHGLWNPYDSHIPLVWYGWKVKPGKTNRETYMTDIAPTLAAILRIQMPSGSIGKVIEEVVK